MDHQSPSRRSGIPLGDISNTYRTEGLQEGSASNDRKRQRDKERYAAMSREKKDGRNRKERERRRMKKALSDGIRLGQVHVPMEENGDNECLQSGQLFEHCQETAGGEVLTNADSNVQGINDSSIDATIDGAWGEALNNAETNGGVKYDSCIGTSVDGDDGT